VPLADVRCSKRLGGLLKSYSRRAAKFKSLLPFGAGCANDLRTQSISVLCTRSIDFGLHIEREKLRSIAAAGKSNVDFAASNRVFVILAPDGPRAASVESPKPGRVDCRERLGGHVKHYYRRAA
jgi:hypothetical protein